MSIRNQNWYNLQSTRSYPIDENSLCVDDTGKELRNDILVDCHIKFPNTFGLHVHVTGITVSQRLVTVVFSAVENLTSSAGTPIAAVSLLLPIEPYINYAVTPLLNGVSGWVVFGPGVETPFSARYSEPRQAFLAQRCGRAYRPLPIPSIAKLGLEESLKNVVNIAGDLPVKVSYVADAGKLVRVEDNEKVTINEHAAAIVVELDTAQITSMYNPLKDFLGPCGQRPESGTCPKTPIETINGVAPDCDGNIQFVFNGIDAQLFSGCGGMDLVYETTLDAACAGTDKKIRKFSDDCCAAKFEVPTAADLDTIPENVRVAGLVVKTTDTNERWTLNEDLATWTAASSEEYCVWPDPTDQIPDIIIDELPLETIYPPVSLPFCADFNSCDGSTPAFDTVSGAFAVAASDAAPPVCQSCEVVDPLTVNSGIGNLSAHNVYASTNSSILNIATFKNSATDWALNKTIATELEIKAGGLERSAGLLLNYRKYLNTFQQLQTTFISVVLDVTRGQLRVLRYTNNSSTVESSVAVNLKTNTWYRLFATPILNGNFVSLNVSVENITDGSASASAVVNIPAYLWGDFTGKTGLFSSRTYANFNKFTITEPVE